jgi:DNA-binding transcriptional MerR regulator
MNVKAVVQLTGVNENTLRSWERRYQAIVPKRNQKGRRDYDAQDVERIEAIWALVREGHSISLIANETTEDLKKKLGEVYFPTLRPGRQYPEFNENLFQRYTTKILQSLEQFQLQQVHQTLSKATFELAPKDIVLQLVIPLIERVGEYFVHGRISVAQEHLLSALIRDYLGTLYQSLNPYEYFSRVSAKSALFTTREGDHHELGILCAAIICNINGMRTYYLGPNMPIEGIVQSVQHLKVDHVILGMMSLPEDVKVVKSETVMLELDLKLPKSTKIVWGGTESIQHINYPSGREIIPLKSLSQLEQFAAALAGGNGDHLS